MAPVPNGVYGIAKGEGLLTPDLELNSRVVILNPTEPSAAQEWIVEGLPNGNVTIKNVKFPELFITFDGEPESGKTIFSRGTPREWQLRPASEPSTFFIVVPGGPVDNQELVLDRSPLKISPPQTALLPIRENGMPQTWKFQSRE